ncbi:MAG: hypothetical protein ABSF69_02850 [Polyangiaceae bacterium]|jgi:hypothetical protein
MTSQVRWALVGVAVTVLGLLVAPARAQTTTATTPTVLADPNDPYPTRIVDSVNLGVSTRPIGLNPDGVNYADCISDMTLQYTVFVSGFTGQELEVWVSSNGDCTQDVNRGTGGVAVCWEVATLGAVNQVAQTSVPFNIRVQDLVGPQAAVPPAPSGPVHEGASACLTQPTETAVTLTVYVVPVVSGYIVSGATSFQQQIVTDLVGPSPPANVSIADGDTLFVLNWTANDDADTYGYDVFIDPMPGATGTIVDASSATGPVQLICPDAGSSSISSSSSSSDLDSSDLDSSPGDSSSSSTTSSSSSQNACYLVSLGPTSPIPGTTSCNSQVLLDESVQDSGVVSTTVNDAGDLVEASTSESGLVGVATIPCQYLVGATCTAGQPVYTSSNLTVIGETDQSYTITGLIDFGPGGTLSQPVDYTVVVAAVDASGNVGPPSPEACDYPAPVNDFYALYRKAGGTAGGGFCALEAVGMPVGSSAAALGGLGAVLLGLYRRRRRRS